MERSANPVVPIAWLVAYLAVLLNLGFPLLRFSWSLANIAFFGAAQFLPFLAIESAVQHLAGWRRAVLVTLSAPLALLSIGLAAGSCTCVACVATDGADYSFEKRESVGTSHGRVVAYRTNGGATTSFGIVIRQECNLLPGLLVVRRLGGEYPASEAQFEWSGGSSVRATFPSYEGKRPEATVQELPLSRLPCLFGAG